VYKIVIAFAAIGGTSFFQANLTAADFTGCEVEKYQLQPRHPEKNLLQAGD
jgi:uncharacterized protein YjbI with pentapeptide repeats